MRNTERVPSLQSNLENVDQFRNGQVLEEYSSNVVGALKLFDELIRIKYFLDLDNKKVTEYQKTKDIVWTWLYSTEGPMKTFVWKGYFEDMPNDPHNKNLNQLTPLEFARDCDACRILRA